METLTKRIKQHEGLSLEPYRLQGLWHIGYGHLTGGKWEAISIHTADEILKEDIYYASDRFQKWRRKHCKKLDTDRCRVCVEMVFWVGFKGFKRFVKMTKAIEDQDYKMAALELYNSELGKKHSKRARTLAQIMWEGKSP